MTSCKCPDLDLSSGAPDLSVVWVSGWTDFRHLDQHLDFARIGRVAQRPTLRSGGGRDRIQIGTQSGHGGSRVRLCSFGS